MNFLDTFDIAGQSTPPRQSEQNLNEEVNEVIGQLGRFWGGFKKQASCPSQNVLQTARKDFGEVVTQAQKELTKFTGEQAEADAQPGTSTSATPPTNIDREVPTSDEIEGQPSPPPSSNDTPNASTASTSSTSLFSRLQSALPPNLLETARNQIPESLKHASENMDLNQLRTNFMTEFQRVQGVTRAQAEEYAHKSETLFREAVKEAGEVLRDAVKILPPEESSSSSGLVWDGSDMWSLPLEPSDTTPTRTPSKSQRRAEAQVAVATRAESLFRRLRHDPVIIRRDPAVDGGELYSSWVASEVESREGGISGEYWTEKIEALLGEAEVGETLKTTRDVLVPSELTEGGFWTRYFFRAHQIEAEEQKRKALLEGTLEEEEFSWEDEEEEHGVSEVPSGEAQPDNKLLSASNAVDKAERRSGTFSTTSSSAAQDEEYDVVSSGNVSPKETHKIVKPEEPKDSSDGDSDWE
ncbi:hypothetical protein H0H92_009938 [Tricholoma furcatifolium]|nr:hypothetical protein H0H92_009938 [Tricholoma furcatifolium]